MLYVNFGTRHEEMPAAGLGVVRYAFNELFFFFARELLLFYVQIRLA